MWQMFGAPDAVRQESLGNLLEFERKQQREPQLVRLALETGETQSGEVCFEPAWGSAAQLRVTVAPLRAASGEISGALLLSEDVTERNELERRLRLAQKMEAVGQLAAGIAHEINTPMAYVRSNLGSLHEDWNALREEIRKDPESETTAGLLAGAEALIDESLEGVERTIAIARDMREFAHSATAARVPTDLNHELEACSRLASAQYPGVTITEAYGELPLVPASAGQLRQVFLNLIVNALQAVSASGNVSVSSAHEAGFAAVRVRDDGCGIARELQHRLFEPFFSTKAAGEGTGLGLYISYEIVRAHGGEIRVDSAPGEGSTFEVRLPLGRS
jgi:signal transduction histidine kinase